MGTKTHKTRKIFRSSFSALSVATALATIGFSSTVSAAGLGKIQVFSALGQPLKAEIEISASKEELSDMRAQMAAVDAFKQSGLDYVSTLSAIRFGITKKTDGRAVVTLSSERPINDPFIDLLLELNWASGRLVREYTFLLDPPEFNNKRVAASGANSRQSNSPVVSETASKRTASPRQGQASPSQSSTSDEHSYRVKTGDTLHKIATETKYQGASVEQMLVGLFNSNKDAFEAGNMNRLKTGQILSVPDESTVKSTSAAEAHKIVMAQSSDWSGYRSKLAGAVAGAQVKADTGVQAAEGKISIKVQESNAADSNTKDQVKVSKTIKGDAGGASKLSEEDALAKDKSLKEAGERIAMLEKNVAELQKLLELKNQSLADLQNKSGTTGANVATDAGANKPTSPSTPTDGQASVEKNDVQPVNPASANNEAVTEAPKPVEPPKKVAPPTIAPPEEAAWYDEILANPLMLGGGVGVIGLVGVLAYLRRRNKTKEEPISDISSTLSSDSSSLVSNSVFRSTGGQSVDTSSQTPAQTDFSQAGPGSIDTDEVDPVAEADVYMAYGRDAQAEEILLEARSKDPKRFAITQKLLEIYVNRKDAKSFETFASEVFAETGGIGSDWSRVSEMGRSIDAENPLYGSQSEQSEVSPASNSNLLQVASSIPPVAELASLATTSSDDSLFSEEGEQKVTEAAEFNFELPSEENKPSDAASTSDLVAGMAFDEVAQEASPAAEVLANNDTALDFDLSMDFGADELHSDVPKQEQGAAHELDLNDLDFGDLGEQPSADGVVQATEPSQFVAPEDAPIVVNDLSAVETTINSASYDATHEDVEFDVDLSESTFLGRTDSVQELPSFDLNNLDLDLSAELPEAEIEVRADNADHTNFASERDSDASAITSEPDFSAELPELSFDDFQVSTAVNPNFGQPQDELATSASDESSDETATLINPHIDFGMNEAEFDVPANEEVATKLDLAKAYEEMGDLDGARELLREVIGEGNSEQQAQAKEILGRIGE